MTEEVLETKTLLEYFNYDELAANAWYTKYRIEGEETPDDMHRRLAREFARIEKENYILDEAQHEGNVHYRSILSKVGRSFKYLKEDEIYELFKDFKYIIPQGSIMAQLGVESIGSLSNCFVIGQPSDSYGGIFKKDEETAQLMKRRGGVGLDISKLRPENVPTSNAAKTSTGSVSFAHRFSNTTREVAQNGRRGALMISQDIKHPDVMEFITVKRDLQKVTGANISIRLGNDFMQSVENDFDFFQRWPIDLNIKYVKSEDLEYNKLTPYFDHSNLPVGYVQKISAKHYWDEIIKSAHGVAEPGLLFIDNHFEYSPDGVYEQYRGVTTNPCVVGDTLVLTNIGWIKFKTLYKLFKDENLGDIKIITRDKFGNMANSELTDVMLTQENAEIYRIDLSNGEFHLVNDKHKFYDLDYNEVVAVKSQGKQIIGGQNGVLEIMKVTKLDYREDVFDLTAKPNYNFFGIFGREEFIVKEDVILNKSLRLKAFEIVETTKGFKFAKDLVEGDEIFASINT